ncbi:MAG: gamma-glutamylcyclotransferase [Rhodospirillaceae bacterium]
MSGLPDAEWVFGYGSLMWNPGFPFTEQRAATLTGYHRAFCMISHHHRGTRDVPGLVLGLDRGGQCDGVAYRVAPAEWAATVTYLNERELVGYAYRPTVLEVTTPAGAVRAFTYVADPDHPNYAGRLAAEAAAAMIREARGIGGRNRDYLADLVAKLDAMGGADAALRALLGLVAADGGK